LAFGWSVLKSHVAKESFEHEPAGQPCNFHRESFWPALVLFIIGFLFKKKKENDEALCEDECWPEHWSRDHEPVSPRASSFKGYHQSSVNP
jgi:hypothetical protein